MRVDIIIGPRLTYRLAPTVCHAVNYLFMRRYHAPHVTNAALRRDGGRPASRLRRDWLRALVDIGQDYRQLLIISRRLNTCQVADGRRQSHCAAAQLAGIIEAAVI